jgi:hypothetical protein
MSSPPPEDGNRSSFRNVMFYSFWNTGWWTKSKTHVILSAKTDPFLHLTHYDQHSNILSAACHPWPVQLSTLEIPPECNQLHESMTEEKRGALLDSDRFCARSPWGSARGLTSSNNVQTNVCSISRISQYTFKKNTLNMNVNCEINVKCLFNCRNEKWRNVQNSESCGNE